MPCLRTLLTAFAVVSGVAANPAVAAEELAPCGTSTLFGERFEVTLIDHGDAGDSLGDRRIGMRELVDSDNRPLGVLRWVEEVVAIDEDGVAAVTHSRNIYTLPDGTLHADGQFRTDVAMDEENQPSGGSAITVIGGTGAYVMSRGVIVATFEPGRPSRYVFELHCN